MALPEPFCREAGDAQSPGVVCLHSNASTSGQWRGLMERLAPRCHVLAPDSLGAGKSPPWPAGGGVTLRDEAALLEPVFRRAGEPFILVGHSYGAAIALVAALARPQRVRAIAVYEPTLFWLADAEGPPPNDADGIRHAAAAAAEAVDRGDLDGAARHFIDYWMGEGSWAATPPARRPAVAESMRNVRGWAQAATGQICPVTAFRDLSMPVLFMMGRDSPLSARAVAPRLLPQLPHVQLVEFEGLGHMAPVTHPDPVNAAIAAFVERQLA